MKHIALIDIPEFAIVSDIDYDFISRFKWRSLANPGKTIYARTHIGKRTVLMHSLILPEANMVDHRDGNGLKNQRENIRPCTPAQNMSNRRKQFNKSTSKFKGVHWVKSAGRWESVIKHNKKAFYLGRFGDELEAAKAYNSAAKRLHGEFSRLNILP